MPCYTVWFIAASEVLRIMLGILTSLNSRVSHRKCVIQVTLHNMLRANTKRDGGLLVDESWRRVTWLQKECVLVLADTGGAGGTAVSGRREAGFLGDETGGGDWKVKMGEEAEDNGEKDGEYSGEKAGEYRGEKPGEYMGEDIEEDKVEVVNGDEGEANSEPE